MIVEDRPENWMQRPLTSQVAQPESTTRCTWWMEATVTSVEVTVAAILVVQIVVAGIAVEEMPGEAIVAEVLSNCFLL